MRVEQKPLLHEKTTAFQAELIQKWETAKKRGWFGKLELTPMHEVIVVDVEFVMDLLKYTEKQAGALRNFREQGIQIRDSLTTGGKDANTTTGEGALGQAQGIGDSEAREE